LGAPVRFLLAAPEDRPTLGQLSLAIESGLVLYASVPDLWPDDPNRVREPTEDEMTRLLNQLKHKLIADAYLSEREPHLIVVFDSGEALFVWGSDKTYESWHVEVLFSPDEWRVSALPQNQVAVVTPTGWVR
jgi:hypothetical protein